jgi:hypothetical protein
MNKLLKIPMILVIAGFILAVIHILSGFSFVIPDIVRYIVMGGALWYLLTMVLLFNSKKQIEYIFAIKQVTSNYMRKYESEIIAHYSNRDEAQAFCDANQQTIIVTDGYQREHDMKMYSVETIELK